MSARRPSCGRRFLRSFWAGSTASPPSVRLRHLAKIAALQLRELAGRLQKQNVTLETAPELPERLGALCANEPGGARSLRRRLQTGIEGPAAELLLRDPSVRTLRAVWQQGSVQVEAVGGCF